MGMSFKRALTATVLTAGLLAGNVVPAFAADAPATGTSQGGAAPVATDKKVIEVTEALANWDFRRSFREYVGFPATNGEGEYLDNTVKLLDKGRNLLWKVAPGQKLDLSGTTGQLKFEGKVSWKKYGGILDVWIANPTIDFKKKQLLVDAYTAGTMAKAGKVTLKSQPLADLQDLKVEVRDGYAVISSLKPVLTANVKSLVGFYEGETGEPFVATIPLGNTEEGAPDPVLWEIFPNEFKNPKNGPVYSDAPTKEVRIPDENLRKCIRNQYDLLENVPITNKHLEGLQELKCQKRGIKSIEGLQYATNLETVNFYENQLTDLTPLKLLKKLKDVNVSANKLSSLEGLESSPEIHRLDADNNQLSTIPLVKQLVKLNWLSLSNNRISDLSQLAVPAEDTLNTLDLSHNKIEDLSGYKDLPFAEKVNLSHNLIEDVGTLPRKKAIQELNLEYNFITDPSSLAEAAWKDQIKSLKLNANKIENWDSLEVFDKEFVDKYSGQKGPKIIKDFPHNEEAIKKYLNEQSKEDAKAKKDAADAKADAERKALVEEAKKLHDQYVASEKEIEEQQAQQREREKNINSSSQKPKEETKKAEYKVALNWGVKESFRKYVSGFAEGKWELSDGVTGTFDFPLKDALKFKNDADISKLEFGGKVHFTGHHGLLDLTISEPTIEKTNTGWNLVATIAVNPFDKKNVGKVLRGEMKIDPTKIETKRVTLATLAEPKEIKEGDIRKLQFGTAKLTAEGANSFANFYETGQELDPVTVVIKKNDGKDAPSKEPEKNPEQNAGEKKEAPAPNTPQTETKKPEVKKCEIDPHKKRVTAGNLSWGLRSSFTTYIRSSVAHGGWNLVGASWDGSSFNFGATGGLYNTSTKSGTIYYGGAVHFYGHDGILDLKISNPALVIKGNSGSLYMDVLGSDMSGKKFNLGRVHFANVGFANGLSATDNALSFQGASVNLTAEGAKAFAGFYKAGEPLAPLSGTAKLVPATACDSETGELIEYDAFGSKLAKTGVELSTLVVVALGLMVIGGGAVVAYRVRQNKIANNEADTTSSL